MKVQLNPLVSGFSGRAGNLVVADKALEMVDTSIVGSRTWARVYVGLNASASLGQWNIVLLFQLTTNYFNLLKADTAAYATWVAEAAAYQASLGRVVTAIMLFRSFYQQKFLSILGANATPLSLSNGTSLSWADRDTRVWSAV